VESLDTARVGLGALSAAVVGMEFSVAVGPQRAPLSAGGVAMLTVISLLLLLVAAATFVDVRAGGGTDSGTHNTHIYICICIYICIYI